MPVACTGRDRHRLECDLAAVAVLLEPTLEQAEETVTDGDQIELVEGGSSHRLTIDEGAVAAPDVDDLESGTRRVKLGVVPRDQ